MDKVDVAVVGAGVMGAAAARSLAAAGRRVLMLEQFDPGHDRGSSHGTSRIFRFSYPDAHYVSMAAESLPLWRELESESGRDLLVVTGGFDTGPRLDDHVAALTAHGVRFEIVTGRDASARWPLFDFGDGDVLYQPDAAYIAADLAVRAFIEGAVAYGAELSSRDRVLAIEPGEGSVTVVTDGRRIEAAVAVVTAGGWAAKLLAPAGIELPVRVTRETVAYFAASQESFPALVEWAEPALYSLVAPGVGLKAGEHVAGPEVDPDSAGAPDVDAVRRLETWIGARYPTLDSTPVAAQTCLYTNTADQSFVLERHGAVVVGSACSGHGFKFAPLIGRRLAALAADALA